MKSIFEITIKTCAVILFLSLSLCNNLKNEKNPTKNVPGKTGTESISVSISSDYSVYTNKSPIPVIVEFGEDISEFTISDIIVTNGSAENFISNSASLYSVDIVPELEGMVTVDINANVAQNSSGDYNTAAESFMIMYDITKPGVNITSAITSPTNVSPVTVTFEFDEDVEGFTSSDIIVNNGAGSSFVSVSPYQYSLDITPSSDGLVTIDLNADIAQDYAGNNNLAATQYSFIYDSIAPTVTISSAESNYTNLSPFTVNIDFSKDVSGFSLSDVDVSNGSAGNFQEISQNQYSIDITPDSDSLITVDIAADIAQDAAGNYNFAADQFSITYDGTGPTIVISSTELNPTNAPSFIVNIDFNEDVIGFEFSDIIVNNAIAGNFTVISASKYTIDIAPLTDGPVTVNVNSSVAQDIVGNDNTAAPQFSITYDITKPNVDITSVESVLTNLSTFTITVDFDEDVSGFDQSEILATNSTTGNFNIISASQYTIDVSPLSDGLVTVNVAADIAQDAAGNYNNAAAQFSISYDGTEPTVVISSTEVNPTNSASFTVNIDFDEDVTGFDLSDVIVSNCTPGNFITISASQYTVDIAPITDGSVTINIDSGVAQDNAGNYNTAAAQYDIVYDISIPSVTITSAETGSTNLSTFTVTIDFSEDMTGFDESDIAITNSTKGNFTAVSASLYTIDISPSSDGSVTVDVAADAAQDLAGNNNTAADQFSINYDGTLPEITAAETMDSNGDGQIDYYKLTFTENIKDDTFPGYVQNDFGNPQSEWLIAGYSDVVLAHGTYAPQADIENDDILFLTFTQSGSGDTGDKPDLTTSSSPNLTDLTNNVISQIQTLTVTEIDKALPVITAAEGISLFNEINISFSEAVDTDGGICDTLLIGTDFIYNDVATGGASSIISVGSDNNGCDNDAVIILNANPDESDVADDTISAEVSSIYDASGNIMLNTPVNITKDMVQYFYSGGTNWNAYVKNDGPDIFSASNTACSGFESGYYDACIHGGEMRAFEVKGRSDCTGLTAEDNLSAFEWVCLVEPGPVVKMVSSALKENANLSDLIDFSGSTWKNNYVTVYDGGTPIVTSGAGWWWGNNIVADNDGGVLDVSGNIYIITSDPAAAYTISADMIALLIEPGITLTGPATGAEIIDSSSRKFLWIEGAIDATSDNRGVSFGVVRFSVLRNMNIINANGGAFPCGIYMSLSTNNYLYNINLEKNYWGLRLYFATENIVEKVNSINNDEDGVYISFSSINNIFRNISASGNNYAGVYLGSDENYLSHITSANNYIGIYITRDMNVLNNISVMSNEATGISIYQADNNILNQITSANNDTGVYVGNSVNNIVMNITAANNFYVGIRNTIGADNVFVNANAVNNGYGINLTLWPRGNTLVNINSAHNTNYGMQLHGHSSIYFSGIFQVGNNGSGDCYNYAGVSTGFEDDNITYDDTNHLGLCIEAQPSDFGTATTGITLASSFTGKVTSDGSNIDGGATGTATLTDSFIFDWKNFDNFFRGWGLDGSAFPNTDNRNHLGCSTNFIRNQTDCTGASGTWSGDGRIWDWTLQNSDTAVRDVNSIPTGNDIITNLYSANSCTNPAYTSQFTCESNGESWIPDSAVCSLIPGSIWGNNVCSIPAYSDQASCEAAGFCSDFEYLSETDCINNSETWTWGEWTSNQCYTVFLRNAVEIMDDGIGNENLLCESSEDCLFTPNIASYQGHGNLISAGAFTDGNITGVNLWMYETNGY
jgi:hypothetical protein